MFRKFNFCHRTSLTLLGLLVFSTSAWSATQTICTTGATTGPVVLTQGDTLIINQVAGVCNVNHSITVTGLGNLAAVQVASGTTVQINNGVNVIIGNSVLAPSTPWVPSAGTWNGVRIDGSSGVKIFTNNTFTGINAANTAMYIRNGAVVYMTGNTITGGTTGLRIENASPYIVRNNISGSTNGVWLFDTLGTTNPILSINNISGPADIRFFSNFARTIYAENNFSSGGFANVLQGSAVAVDSLPDLANDPTISGTSAASPILINTGTYDAPAVDLYNVSTTGMFYRAQGTLTVSAGSALTMGNDLSNTSVGATVLELANAAVNLNINGTFTSNGISGSVNQIRSPGSAGVGTRGSINMAAGSTSAFNFTTVRDGLSNVVNGTAVINCTNSQFINNTTGLTFSGTGASTVAFTNCDIGPGNTMNLDKNSAGMLTIENVYWGSITPNAALFTGVGIVDYEPWRTGSLGTGILASSPPTSVNANSPTHNALMTTSPLTIGFSATDIGMHNGLPIDYTIEIATDPTFTTIVQRHNPNGRAGVGADLNQGSFSAATYASGAPAIYNVGTPLPQGVYYYRVRGFDALGSVSLGAPGGQLTPVANNLPYTLFTIGSAQVHVTVNVNNVTKAQYPALNADAGDTLEYVVTYKNFGLVAAVNATLTNVLPTDVFTLGSVSHNVTSAVVAPTVVISSYSDNTGLTLIAQDTNLQVSGVDQLVNWTTNALTPAESLVARRISFNFTTISPNDTGTLRYRVRVR